MKYKLDELLMSWCVRNSLTHHDIRKIKNYFKQLQRSASGCIAPNRPILKTYCFWITCASDYLPEDRCTPLVFIKHVIKHPVNNESQQSRHRERERERKENWLTLNVHHCFSIENKLMHKSSITKHAKLVFGLTITLNPQKLKTVLKVLT